MGQHSDSINHRISRPVHEAMHESTMAIIDCLKQAGCDVSGKIDFNPSTGEVIMSPKTVKALRVFMTEIKEKKISIDKLMYADNLEKSGYYVFQGREITPAGVIVSEGEVIGFVQIKAVENVEDRGGVLV